MRAPQAKPETWTQLAVLKYKQCCLCLKENCRSDINSYTSFTLCSSALQPVLLHLHTFLHKYPLSLYNIRIIASDNNPIQAQQRSQNGYCQFQKVQYHVMLGKPCSCLFLNPISEAEQASMRPLGGDLGPMRLTLDSAALDWSQTTCRISTV